MALVLQTFCMYFMFLNVHNVNGIWAAWWQNQQNDYAPSEDPDQPGHPPSLIRVFAVRSVGISRPKRSSCGQRRLWSDWTDAQADLSLCWAYSQFVGFVMWRLIYVNYSSIIFHRNLITIRSKLFIHSVVCIWRHPVEDHLRLTSQRANEIATSKIRSGGQWHET